MNEKYAEKRRRHKTLFVVEGIGGETKLLSILARSFPELEIDTNDVITYKTNISLLYHDIAKYYEDENWTDNGVEIDLPFMVSEIQKQRDQQKKQEDQKQKEQNICQSQFSVDYTNIILMFDFDLQDPHFSQDRIIALQKYFNEMTGKGKLFINYPMVESYLHFSNFDDIEFLDRTVPTSIKNGGEYKDLVKHNGNIEKFFDFTHTIQEGLKRNNVPLEMHDTIVRKIAEIKRTENIIDAIEDILEAISDKRTLNNLKHYFDAKYKEMTFIKRGESYYDAIRHGLEKLIWITLYKSLMIQTNTLDISLLSYKYVDFESVLIKQISFLETCKKLWVLNTSLLIVMDFNSNLIGSPPSFLLSNP